MILYRSISFLCLFAVSYGWPILLSEDSDHYSIKVEEAYCGESNGDSLFHNEFIELSSEQDLAPGCVIQYRVTTQSSHVENDFEHYGFEVKGWVDVSDSENVINEDSNECTASQLMITDSDNNPYEKEATTQTLCGNHEIYYITQEDSVRIILKIEESFISGKGFNVTIRPKYECGGQITNSTTIQSPEYPNTYPKGTNCMWDITVPPGQIAELTCPEFKLPSRKRSHCPHRFLLEIHEPTDINGKAHERDFCDEEFLSNPVIISEGESIIYFSSSIYKRRSNQRFKCDLTYKDAVIARSFYK